MNRGKSFAGLGLTDAQLTNRFGVSGAQLATLKAVLSDMASKFDAATALAGQ